MLKTYFLVAMRVLRRNKAYSLLNILGLSIGVAASILIFLVIRWETGYDSYQKNKDRVFRVVTTTLNRSNGEVTEQHAYAPLGLGDVVQKEVAGVERVSAIFKYSPWQAHISAKGIPDGKIFLQKNIISAEPALFNMIDVEWLDGNASGLVNANTIVVSSGVAEKWFGRWQSAVGKTIWMGSSFEPYTVMGVFRDLPSNTELPLEMVMSYEETRQGIADAFNMPDRWHYPARHSELFVQLGQDRDIRQAEGALAGIVGKYYNENQAAYKTRTRLELQSLPSMHLDERFDTFKGDALSKKVLWSLGTIGMLLLVVACINFINLSTAQSIRRSKEIGVRKVLGSNRWQLLKQFMLETAAITFAALLLGAIMAQLALPWLQQVMGKPVEAEWFRSPSLLFFILSTGLVVVALAGFYPAVVLSSFDVIAAIKNKISARTIGGLSLRRGLVVIQFVIAQLLIMGTIVVVKQMQYFRTRPMGFDQTAVALLQLPGYKTFVPLQPYLKKTMLDVPGVEAAALSNEGPSGGRYWRQQSLYFDHSPVAQDWKPQVQVADPDFIKTMRIPLIAGVIPDSGRKEVLINETMMKRLGLASSQDALGKTIALNADSNTFRITGVVRDYNNQSLREAIEPVVIMPEGGGYNYLTLRIRPEEIKSTVERVQKAFSRICPDILFDCQWLDERIAHFYEREQTTSQLVKVFAGLAILISCLGLYGLVAFLAVQKMKEVGIRKVLGASVGSIVLLFSQEFTLLTGLAFLIAAPVGYLVMHKWLQGFYYHVDLGWETFAITIVAALLVAWLTVGYKAWKAARVNPVESLKGE
ncbi:MAG: ABC transporter permease [Bacteroidetes bacterium]|nr:ABC transporter permease [Bacteroidota bacterium]